MGRGWVLLVIPIAAACGAEASGVPGRGGLVASSVGGADGMNAMGSGASGQGASVGGAGGMYNLPEGPPCEVDGTLGVCVDVAVCVGAFAPVPGYCAGSSQIQCCVPIEAGTCNPNTMVVPDGTLTEAEGVGGCPAGMVPVDAFCIDAYEAALVNVSDGSTWSPYFNPESAPVRAVSVKGAVPQGYVEQVQADAACLAAGKRLCTDEEWLRACRGPEKQVYPYGDALVLGRCNDHRDVHPAVEYFGTTDSWIYSEIGDACLNQLPNSLDLAGANADCVTPDGVFDLMGNLHEWTADPAGTFRGGFYVDTVINGSGCLYATTAHDVSHWDYSTGFRCCLTP